jgi:hypothetical protein
MNQPKPYGCHCADCLAAWSEDNSKKTRPKWRAVLTGLSLTTAEEHATIYKSLVGLPWKITKRRVKNEADTVPISSTASNG